MPGPAVPLAVGGILLLAYLLGKKKDEPAAPALIDNTSYTDTGGGGYIPPKVEPGTPAKRYAYTLASGDTLYGLAQKWGGGVTNDVLQAFADENPTLKKVDLIPVVWVPNDPAGAGGSEFARQTISVPAGTDATVSVPADGVAGTSWPANPTPGFAGQWHTSGARAPGVSPWQVGQTVAIPAAWGAPPAELAGNAHEFAGA